MRPGSAGVVGLSCLRGLFVVSLRGGVGVVSGRDCDGVVGWSDCVGRPVPGLVGVPESGAEGCCVGGFSGCVAVELVRSGEELPGVVAVGFSGRFGVFVVSLREGVAVPSGRDLVGALELSGGVGRSALGSAADGRVLWFSEPGVVGLFPG
ncbi:hypothetical protein [Nocardia sp. NPDC050710]|uniref:hypothetical protein n=1 Tax=Nocardia sp. NPDC050710 TaxID=3157220 RepID=UPI00340D8D54